MRKQLGEHLPESERAQFLADNCDGREEMSYMRQFSNEEMLLQKESLAEISIALNDLDEKKKSFTAQIELEKKPLKKELVEVRTNIKQKAILVDELTYKLVDQEAGEVGFYNSYGDLVMQRPIHPSERQGNLFKIEKTGTNE